MDTKSFGFQSAGGSGTASGVSIFEVTQSLSSGVNDIVHGLNKRARFVSFLWTDGGVQKNISVPWNNKVGSELTTIQYDMGGSSISDVLVTIEAYGS